MLKERLMGQIIPAGIRFMRFLFRETLSSYYADAYAFPGGEAAAKSIDFTQLILTRKAINRVDIEDRLAALKSGKTTKPIDSTDTAGSNK